MQVTQSAVGVFTRLLEQHTGQELTKARQWRLGPALAGVLRENNYSDINQLSGAIGHDFCSPLSRQVVEALLNNETYFFRDLQVFQTLANRILPAIISAREPRRRLSIWCAGCSTGQEALSLAMILAENKRVSTDWQIDIIATDVSESALSCARKGYYNQFQIQRGIDVTRMLRWFSQSGEGWAVSPVLRSRIRYITHNVLNPPPTARRFDLILCRNVLFYFDQATRARAYTQLASAIAGDGYLLLGGGETVCGHTDLFDKESGHPGFYRPSLSIANMDEAIRKPS
jgi:chemotaxis protein methyltransferase CheR